MTLRAGLGSLRSQLLFPTLRVAIGRANRRDPHRFRIVHFSAQSNHLHLIVEAADRRALSAGVRSIAIRVALYVNQLLRRTGRFWADRWHGHTLRTPLEVRNALVYVLGNFRKHARRPLPSGIDPYSSARWFDGFSTRGRYLRFAVRAPPAPREGPPVSAPETWLLATGWRRRGPLHPNEAPRG